MLRIEHEPATYPHRSVSVLPRHKSRRRPFRMGLSNPRGRLDYDCIFFAIPNVLGQGHVPVHLGEVCPVAIRGFAASIVLRFDGHDIPDNGYRYALERPDFGKLS